MRARRAASVAARRPRYGARRSRALRAPRRCVRQVANGEVVCENFKVKRSKDYFDKKRGSASNLGSCTDIASMASVDSAANLSSLGGSTVDLAAMDVSENGDGKKGAKKPAAKPPKGKK